MLLLGLGLLDQAEQHLGEVADDDEGRGQRRPAVVLHDEVVALELPEDVRVALHHLEGVAGEQGASLSSTSCKSQAVICISTLNSRVSREEPVLYFYSPSQ